MLRNRIVVLGLLILSIIAISFYGGPITYGFFFLMLLIPAISAGYAFLTYLRFRIYQKILTKNVIAGNPTDYFFTLQNEDRFSFSGIKVEFFSDFSYVSELTDNFEYELPPHSGLKKETVLICKYRGEYDVGIRNVIVQDYLRLFRFNFPAKEKLSVIVLPRLEILDSLRSIQSIESLKDSPNDPSSLDVLIREYTPGDDLRKINWKASAHLGKPYIRNAIGEETLTIGIIMDPFRGGNDPYEYLPIENKILETTLAIAHFFLSKNINASFFSYEGKPVKYALQGIDTFEDFYAFLSSFTFSKDNSHEVLFASAMRSKITSTSFVYMILHEISDEVISLINEINKYGIPVVIYHITDEVSDSLVDLGKNSEYIRIGYEDRLKEVL